MLIFRINKYSPYKCQNTSWRYGISLGTNLGTLDTEKFCGSKSGVLPRGGGRGTLNSHWQAPTFIYIGNFNVGWLFAF
jgi:hypothetical protein